MFEDVIVDEAQLREHYREAGWGALKKQHPTIDDHDRAFLDHCTFAAVSTNGGEVGDVSPRGGPPGFIRVLDERHVAFGDLSGNNRLDTFTNILRDPAIGILAVIPGREEALRINGRALLVRDAAVLEACAAVEGKTPKVALVVEVHEVYLHCAKAFRRGVMWQPEAWPDKKDLPGVGDAFAAQLGLDIDGALIDADLEKNAVETLWEPGGE